MPHDGELTVSGQMFADPVKARKDLEAFADANDARLYKLVKGCVEPQSDLRQIVKAKVSPRLVHLIEYAADRSRMSSLGVSNKLTPTFSTPSQPSSKMPRGTL